MNYWIAGLIGFLIGAGIVYGFFYLILWWAFRKGRLQWYEPNKPGVVPPNIFKYSK
jgi:hypothetical protein